MNRKSNKKVYILIFIICIIAFSFMFNIFNGKADNSDDRIYFISADTGDSMIIETKDNNGNTRCGLVDTLNPSEVLEDTDSSDSCNLETVSMSDNGTKVKKYAKKIGCNTFDFVILTHNHYDHIGGVAELKDMFDSNTIVFLKEDPISYNSNNQLDDYEELGSCGTYKNHEYYEIALQTFNDKNAKICDLTKANQLNSSDCNLSSLHNTIISTVSYNKNDDFKNSGNGYDTNVRENLSFGFGSFNINLYNLYTLSYHRENYNSIVTLITHNNGSKALLTGDIETSLGDIENDGSDGPSLISLGKSNLILKPTGTCSKCTSLGIENQIADVIGKVDVLKGAHHGNNSSNSFYALNIYQPKYYVIEGEYGVDSNGSYPEHSSSNVAIMYLKHKYGTESYFSKQSTGAVVAQFNNDDNNKISIRDYNSNGSDTTNILASFGTYYNPNLSWGKINNLTASDKKWAYYYQGQPTINDWHQTNSLWYHFDEYGIMNTGWFTDSNSNKYYLFDNNYGTCQGHDCVLGEMLVGWQNINDAWYYFENNGPAKTGWFIDSNSHKYYLYDGVYGTCSEHDCSIGEMLLGWQKINGTWYYFDSNGNIHTGWLTYNNNKYYLDADGKMVTGLITIDHKTYYFRPDKTSGSEGSMVTDTCLTIDNSYYCFNADGVGTLTPTVTIPTASTCLDVTYNGSNQVLASAGTGYTLLNNSGTNVGNYTVTAKLNSGYAWNDGTITNKTFTCTIRKGAKEAPQVSSTKVNYDGKPHSISLTNETGNSPVYSTDGITYSTTNPTRINAGVTTVYVKYLGDDNYNDSAVSTGTITINKDKAPIYHSNPDATFIYGEEGTTFRVSTNIDGTFIFSTEGDNFEIITGPVNVSASQGVDVIIRAIKEGTSTLRVQFIPSDTDNYDSSVMNQDITVHSKPVSEPTSNYCVSYIAYDGSEHTLTKDPGEGYTFINNKGTNAGTYTVTAHLKDGYTWYGNSKEDITFDCTIYKVDGEDFTVTNYSGTYDKKPHGLTVTPVTTGTIKYKYGDSDWQTEPFTFTDAGYYSVYVKAFGDQNHKDSDLKTGTISIGYAASNVEFNMIYTSNITQYSTKDFATGTADLPGTYTFSIDDEIIDNYPTSIHANANETVTFYARGVQVGETSLHMTFTPDDTNYQSAAKNFGIVVWPADENVDIPTSSSSCLNNVVYNETSQVLTTSNTVAYEFINNTGINAGNYNVTVRLKNNYKWSDNTKDDKTITCSIKKADLLVPTIKGYTGTYDGKAHTITVPDIPGATIKYSLDNENFTTFVHSRTDVGTTKVYVKYIGDNNHNDSSVYAANITINKANSVISSANLADNIYKGDTLNIGPISANVSGIFTISTANASVLNVPVLAKNVNANEEITTTITGSSVGNTSYTITFTPSSSNYNQSSVTTNVTVNEKPKTSVVIPNSTTHCKTNLKYTGSPLTITNNPLTGYTFTNNVQTNAGTYTVTAKLQDGYIWSDNTLTDKTFSCTILKADSYVNFNESHLVVNNGYVKPRTSADIVYFDLKSMIDTNGVITTNKNDDELVATCDKFTITFDDIVKEYLVIITGDVTKSGNVGNGDVNLLFRYLRNKESLNECQLKAADTTSDNEIHINDVAKIYQFIHLKIDRLGE